MKISVIVPVHNSEKYLKKCVNSLLNQTIDSIEILLIDDFSSDSSPEIIKEYAENNAGKVRAVFLDENIKQGGARNVGIKQAKGEYLCFVDSDDWIEKDMCEELYNAALSADADMAGGNCFISTDSEDMPKNLAYVSAELTAKNKENILKFISSQGYFWNRIYRREMLIKNGIFFPERVFYEDAYFNFLTALYANRVIKIEKNFYHYYQSPNSTVRVLNNERLYDRITVERKIIADCKQRKIYDELKEVIDTKFLGMAASNTVNTCLAKFYKPSEEKLSKIARDVLDYCPDYKSTAAYKSLPAEQKFYLNAAIKNPKAAIWLYKHNFSIVIEYFEAFKNKFRKGAK